MSANDQWVQFVDQAISAVRAAPYGAQIPAEALNQMRATLLATTPPRARFDIGAKAYFQPNLRLVDARTGETDPTVAAPCEIRGISFTDSKVFYDIDVIYVEEYAGSRIESRINLRRVQSDFIAQGGRQ